jgi:hypothetical protein
MWPSCGLNLASPVLECVELVMFKHLVYGAAWLTQWKAKKTFLVPTGIWTWNCTSCSLVTILPTLSRLPNIGSKMVPIDCVASTIVVLHWPCLTIRLWKSFSSSVFSHFYNFVDSVMTWWGTNRNCATSYHDFINSQLHFRKMTVLIYTESGAGV